MIAFYITQRLFGGIWYLTVAFLLPNIRGAMIGMALQVFISVAIWIGSIHVAWPNQLAPIFIGLVLDLFGGIFLVYLFRQAATKKNLKRLAHWFDFMPAINIEHRVERNNAFVSLVSKKC